MQESNMIGTAMASDLTAAGQQGVAIHAMYDFWTPSRHYQAFHGGMRILTESASAKLASPITVEPGELERDALGYNARERSWNFLEPWQGGVWHLRDIVDDQLIAMESCLYQAALHREELLRNFYKIGQRQVARKSPWAFVIPAKQRDPGATRKLLETLEFGQVEIEHNAAGDHVIRMAQPYSGWAKALLERQHYPDMRLYPGGPPQRPYDVTAHTLPLLMGVQVETVDAPLAGLAPAGPDRRRGHPGLLLPTADAWDDNQPRSGHSGATCGAIPADRRFRRRERERRVGRKSSGRASACTAASSPTTTKVGRAGCWNSLALPTLRSRTRPFRPAALRKHFDVIVFPDADPGPWKMAIGRGACRRNLRAAWVPRARMRCASSPPLAVP